MTLPSFRPGHNLRSQEMEPVICFLSNYWSNHIFKNPSTQLSRCQRNKGLSLPRTACCTRTGSQHASKPIGLTGELPSRGTAEVAFPAPGKRQQQHEYRRKCRYANIFLPATMRHPITRVFVTHGSKHTARLSVSIARSAHRARLERREGSGGKWFAGAERGGTRCLRAETVVTGHHNTFESGVVRSDTISNRLGASIEHRVCFWSTEKFRPWGNYGGSSNRQLSFQRGEPSRLTMNLGL